MVQIVDKIRSGVTRFIADRTNQYCVQASLLEAAVSVGVSTKDLGVVLPKTTIAPENMLLAIQEGSSFLGIELIRVLINPSLLEQADVHLPDSIHDRVMEVTGEQRVQHPHIRLLFYDLGGDDGYASHSECDDNTVRARKRIGDLEKQGWFTGAIAEIKKK